jgi:hypothetical protein
MARKTAKKVDLNAIKARLADPDPAPEPEEREREKGPGIRPETMRMARQYEAEVAEMAAAAEQERVELGELPEGAVSDEEAAAAKDPTSYRGTSSDNRRVRLAVEAQCGEMDFADLVLTGRVRQHVPVLPGKIEFEYQSLTGVEDFWVESNAQMESNTEWGVRSWVVYARLSMQLISVNGKSLPSHLNKDGEVDRKAFDAKLKSVMRYGSKVLDVAVTNVGWFNSRVDGIFQDDFEALGNG